MSLTLGRQLYKAALAACCWCADGRSASCAEHQANGGFFVGGSAKPGAISARREPRQPAGSRSVLMADAAQDSARGY